MSPEEQFQQQVQHVLALFSEGRHTEVLQAIQPIIEAHPNQPALYNLAGAAQAARGRLEPAVKFYDRAILLKPDFVDAHSNRGAVLLKAGRLEEALESFELAIHHRAGFAEAWFNRGIVLGALGRWDDALNSQEGAIRLKPEFSAALFHRANALHQLRRLDEALDAFATLIAQQPDHADAYCNRGNVLHELGQIDDAVASFEQAIALRPDLIAAHRNRAICLHQLRELEDAAAAYRAAIELSPDPETISHLIFLKANMCDWQPEEGVDIASLGIASGAVPPFNLIALDDDAERSLVRSANWAKARYPDRRGAASAKPLVRPARLRIGYFSADFHDHATMWLMGSLFAAHDRGRFEVHAFSYGPDYHDAMRARAVETADAFHDVRDRSDADVARFSRDLGIDIAVDLKGYTQDTRPGIFAHGAAPIQVAWLGYPGSAGADFIDYLVADPVVIPLEKRRFYSEKLICLPHSYQINDDRRPIAPDLPDRETLGLPRDGFVFCCFNTSFKISAEAFDIWMRLLERVEGSVLWLQHDNDWAVDNLRREAERRGIDPDRLVFADRLPVADHLARHRHADLFVDTFAYNAHTTASDALWVGVPIVTLKGDGFAGRVATSLLHTLGLPELVTESAEEYEGLALALARDPGRLAAIRRTIEDRRLTSPLFDTPLFARHLERGYELAFDRWLEGAAPDHIEVPALDRR